MGVLGGSAGLDALLARVGLAPTDVARRNTRAFQQLLVLLVAVELWDRAGRYASEPSLWAHLLLALLATAAAAAAFRSRFGASPAVTAAAFVIVAADFAAQFPGSANHHYLQLLCLGFLLLLRRDVDAEVRLLDVSLRWLLVLGLFWAGLQKLLHGYYFEGEFLAFTISQSPRFASVLEPLIPAAEFARIAALEIREGAGPFRVDSPAFVLVSNVAYAAELVLPAGLLFSRTRKLAVVGVLAYFGAIEAAAREVFFGGMMAALALLFWPGDVLRRALPLFALGLLYLLSMIFGLLPRWTFT